MHPDYKWLSADMDDRGYIFKDKPKLGDRNWMSASDYDSADIFTSYKRGNVAWDKSLVKRPEGV